MAGYLNYCIYSTHVFVFGLIHIRNLGGTPLVIIYGVNGPPKAVIFYFNGQHKAYV